MSFKIFCGIRSLKSFLPDKSFQLDQLHQHQQQQDQLEKKMLWSNQLQTNLSEKLEEQMRRTEEDLEENLEIQTMSFTRALIFLKKLVALLLEKHFASAASSQLLGNEAWEKYREASKEISFDKTTRGKELSHNFEENSLTAKNFGQPA